MSLRLPPLLWLDLETTGLDPEKHHSLLEIAIVATDEDLNEEGAHVAQAKCYTPPENWDAAAWDMHAQNGLSQLVIHPDSKLPCVADVLVEAWHAVVDFGWKGRPMAGSSVQFDRMWLRYLARINNNPDLGELFHYRNFDMSTVRMLHGITKRDQRPHRALEDLRADIAEVRELRRKLWTEECELSGYRLLLQGEIEQGASA